ncbi:uncharacterized protein [Salminus brasiliensis]|uniref:uncharacterized protein n=1 Tax=Salminus brasiliensis TaxID=930266 RepID=UPI003B832867
MSEREDSCHPEPESSPEETNDVESDYQFSYEDSSSVEEECEDSSEGRQQQQQLHTAGTDEEAVEKEEEDPTLDGPSTSSGTRSFQNDPNEELVKQLSEAILLQRNQRQRRTAQGSPPSIQLFVYGCGDSEEVGPGIWFWIPRVILNPHPLSIEEGVPPSTPEEYHSSSSLGSEVDVVGPSTPEEYHSSSSLGSEVAAVGPSTPEEGSAFFSAQQLREEEAVMPEPEDGSSSGASSTWCCS